MPCNVVSVYLLFCVGREGGGEEVFETIFQIVSEEGQNEAVKARHNNFISKFYKFCLKYINFVFVSLTLYLCSPEDRNKRLFLSAILLQEVGV